MKKAYNKVTGLWFIWGRGFIAKERKHGTLLAPAEAAVVGATYENVVFEGIEI